MYRYIVPLFIMVIAKVAFGQASFQGLGDLTGQDFFSKARGISTDGSVIVGQSVTGTSGATEAVRWTTVAGVMGLGDLPGGDFQSEAFGVSADGSVVVGQSKSVLGMEAFRWTKETGMIGLRDLPGSIFISDAFAVSGRWFGRCGFL